MLLFTYLILFIGYLGYEGILTTLMCIALDNPEKKTFKYSAIALFVIGTLLTIKNIIYIFGY